MGNHIGTCGSWSIIPSSQCHRIAQIVHANGTVQVLTEPMKVAEIMIDNPCHFLYCQKLNAPHTTIDGKPLAAHDDLELGKVYFLIPSKSMLHKPNKCLQARKERSTCKNVNTIFRVKQALRKVLFKGSQVQDDTKCFVRSNSFPHHPLPSFEGKNSFKLDDNVGAISFAKVGLDMDPVDLYELEINRFVFLRSRSWKPHLETISEGRSLKY